MFRHLIKRTQLFPTQGFALHRRLLSKQTIESEASNRHDVSIAHIPPVDNTSYPYTHEDPYWQVIPGFANVSHEKFLSHKWQMANSVQTPAGLYAFLKAVLPQRIPPQRDMAPHLRLQDIETREQFITRVQEGIQSAPMAVRLSPHILSVINWQDPLNDPVRRQFVPLRSHLNTEHPMAGLDPMKEEEYSPVKGLIHRYPERALFLATSICPVYCRFCFRSYTVGTETETVKKQRYLPIMKKWEPRFEYIERTPALRDIVISGGDTYLLEPEQVRYIGERLLRIPHIQRVRFATKGLAVSPSRILDPADKWADAVIALDRMARELGKHVCVHTHFNSEREITWVSRRATQRLYAAGVVVRNQAVLLNGVNNTPSTMLKLVHALADMNVVPYYVFQGDMVPGAEDLRTPIADSLALEEAVRGNISGFLMPSFIIDLPAEGGKRLTRSVFDYDRRIGRSKLTAPGLKGQRVVMEYWDPLWSLSEEGKAEVLAQHAELQKGNTSAAPTNLAQDEKVAT